MAKESEDEIYFEIHEVFYKKGKPTSYTINPVGPHGHTKKELKKIERK